MLNDNINISSEIHKTFRDSPESFMLNFELEILVGEDEMIKNYLMFSERDINVIQSLIKTKPSITGKTNKIAWRNTKLCLVWITLVCFSLSQDYVR